MVSGTHRHHPEALVTDRSIPAPSLVVLLYLLGLLILADQVTDVLSLLLAQPAVETGSAQWRFITFGLVTSRITALILADVMILGAAVLLQHRIMLRVLGVLHLVLATALLAGLVLFLLDALQLRSMMRLDDRQRLVAAAMRTSVVTALAILVAGITGLVALRATKSHKGRRGLKPDSLLVQAEERP